MGTEYKKYIQDNNTRSALFNGKPPYTLVSILYKKLGKDALKKLSNEKAYKNIIDDIWDIKLTRSIIFDYFHKDKDLYKGYIASLLWGGLGSDGISRNNLQRAFAYTKADILQILARVNELLNQNKIAEAFKSMLPNGNNKINGLGISYFTKLLFFLYPNNSDQKTRPIIFDKWGWHIHATILMESNRIEDAFSFYKITLEAKWSRRILLIPSIFLKDNSKKVNNASVYLDYINCLSKLSNGKPGRLEEFLFGQSRKINKAEDNPRNVLLRCLTSDLEALIKTE